jgi:putative SOS response-associated peptidase YedK
MCGRYTLRTIDLHRIGPDVLPFLPSYEEFDEKRIVPRFNIAPSQDVPMIFVRDAKAVLDMASWGFVPFWTKGKPKTKPINARSETVATSGMFRSAFKSSRCLLPADGFYEWKAGTPKQPYYFHRPDSQMFAFAGLWSEHNGEKTALHLTTTPNAIVSAVHDRMPVILHEGDFEKWLDPEATPEVLAGLLRPYPAKDLVSEPVSTRVNKPSVDDPDLVLPVRLD